MEYIAYYASPLGPLTLSADEAGLTGISFAAPEKVTDDNAVLTQAKRWLDAYFRGETPDPASVPLSLKGTPFQLLIWNRLLAIPYGESVTYGELAREAARHLGKRAMSAQAIGGAVGRNPIPILVPCHRVLGAGNRLTGYSGGLDIKIRLLTHEGCPFR
ncbi:MAG: methylated-DNA--[protein]-cysteine S-methyltransferase [Candidatus Faecousia sp.]|nr:methylated-DNA--[protein]-cysteine S-methyltransferase [Clostridiales bacterium]MDY6180422.1 methylated-DNA--[protein]-cysteine S-methyltransferase [Candidatus Faecousia sp.]